jgi:prevent-host-death family protein
LAEGAIAGKTCRRGGISTKTLTATDARNRFSELIDMAQAGPVRVQRQGCDVAVVLSPEEPALLPPSSSR